MSATFVDLSAHAARRTVVVCVTEDGGRTWSNPRRVGRHPRYPGAKPCEPCLLRAADGGGRIVALLRENARRYGSLLMTSDDEGESWSDMVELPAALTGDRHVARFAPDGRILVTLRDMAPGSDTYGDFVGWVGTWDDLLAGRPGQYRLRLHLDELDGVHGGPGSGGGSTPSGRDRANPARPNPARSLQNPQPR